MNNKDYLFDALGDIDDDLIDDAAMRKSKRKFWPIVAAAACAAALLLVILTGMTDRPDPIEPAQLYTAENLWLRDDFAAYPLTYAPLKGQARSYRLDSVAIRFLNTTTTLPS